MEEATAEGEETRSRLLMTMDSLRTECTVCAKRAPSLPELTAAPHALWGTLYPVPTAQVKRLWRPSLLPERTQLPRGRARL